MQVTVCPPARLGQASRGSIGTLHSPLGARPCVPLPPLSPPSRLARQPAESLEFFPLLALSPPPAVAARPQSMYPNMF